MATEEKIEELGQMSEQMQADWEKKMEQHFATIKDMHMDRLLEELVRACRELVEASAENLPGVAYGFAFVWATHKVTAITQMLEHASKRLGPQPTA